MDIFCPKGTTQSEFFSHSQAFFSRALVIPIYRLLPQFKADEKGFLTKMKKKLRKLTFFPFPVH